MSGKLTFLLLLVRGDSLSDDAAADGAAGPKVEGFARMLARRPGVVIRQHLPSQFFFGPPHFSRPDVGLQNLPHLFQRSSTIAGKKKPRQLRRRTTKISCRAGCNDVISRKAVVAARSTSSADSAANSVLPLALRRIVENDIAEIEFAAWPNFKLDNASTTCNRRKTVPLSAVHTISIAEGFYVNAHTEMV